MDGIVICKSCLQFMEENNKLKKTIRRKESRNKELHGEIRALDLTPDCKTCGKRMSKEYYKDHVDAFRVKRFNSWICVDCLNKDRKKKVENNLEIN